MTKEFEQKLLINTFIDTKKIFNNDDTVTNNYYDCWCYYNEIIDTVSDNASKWLLDELYIQRDYYQQKYLINKGLI